jgi:nucleotide-binding universal stress UspA family protein
VIVVGVDGSKSARAALSWALAEARLRDRSVRIVSAWQIAPVAYGAPVYVPPVEDGLESFERAADEAIEQSLAALDGQADGIRIERRVVEGPPDEALVEAAQDAELLVVGTRGHGELISLLLGSVSHQAAKHASCPVVIVRSA